MSEPSRAEIEASIEKRRPWFARCGLCSLGSRVDMVDSGEHDWDCTWQLTMGLALARFVDHLAERGEAIPNELFRATQHQSAEQEKP